MALKTFNPTTPGQRGLVLTEKSQLHKGKPVKKLVVGLTSSGGRNNHGHVTARRKGGGHKRKYRLIDFKRNKTDIEGIVERVEYDPNRSAFVALIKYSDHELNYIICPQKVSVGDPIISSEKAELKPGNCMSFKSIPVGTIIHNVELKPGKGGQIIRSAGTFAQLASKDSEYAQIKLSSGEIRSSLVRLIEKRASSLDWLTERLVDAIYPSNVHKNIDG